MKHANLYKNLLAPRISVAVVFLGITSVSCVNQMANLENPVVLSTVESSEKKKTDTSKLTGTVLQTVLNFETSPVGAYGFSYLWHYTWGPSGPQWRNYSTFDVVAENNNKYLRMWVSDSIPTAITSYNSPLSKANLNSVIRGFSVTPYLQPEVDTVRVKMKVEQGQIGITFGAPVSQVGNSDVLTAVKYLSSTDMGDCHELQDGWFECDFDFNENLIRNIRRGNFSLGPDGKSIKNSNNEEIIHFTRWVQEQVALYVVPYDSNDNLYIHGNPIVLFDDIQLINKGKGKPFPTIDSFVTVDVINDFETAITNAFTVDFDFPTHQPVPILSHVTLGNTGTKSLQIVSNTHEENAWTGFDAPNGNGANAVSFELKVIYASNDGNPNYVIDFIALATPYGDSFDWTGLSDGTGEYDYVLSRATISNRDLAIYHARRIVPRNQWVTVIIPFSDFAAAYGSGASFSEHHSEQKPLMGSEISVIGLQATFVNSTAITTFQIDAIKYLSITGSDEELRSYWQGQVY